MAGKVRQPIDTAALESWLLTNVPEIQPPLDVQQFGYGQSNPTYLLTTTTSVAGAEGEHCKLNHAKGETNRGQQKRYVLRKKPPGALLSKTAHKVEREYKVLSALGRHNDALDTRRPSTAHATAIINDAHTNADTIATTSDSTKPIPVPRTYALCTDPNILGTPFYIMSFLSGRILSDPAMPGVSAQAKGEMWRGAVRTLGGLHSVDLDEAGLGDFGPRRGERSRKQVRAAGGGEVGQGEVRGGGFYARQLKTWREICTVQAATTDAETGQAVGQLPRFEELVRFFGDEARQPDASVETLVHGDYKIDNLVFDQVGSEVVGILDWEMSTIGHPLSDLANLVLPFYFALSIQRPPPPPSSAAPSQATRRDKPRPRKPIPTAQPGFLPNHTPGLPTLSELVSDYIFSASWTIAADDTDNPNNTNQNNNTRTNTQSFQRNLDWAASFAIFRLAAICQGIAARVARRQASSAAAARHAELRGPLAEFAWELVSGLGNDELDLDVGGDGKFGGAGGDRCEVRASQSRLKAKI